MSGFMSGIHIINGKDVVIAPRADLCSVDLSYSSPSDGLLAGANLTRANLTGANLYHANLRGAKLRGAKLRGVFGWGVNLRNADLTNADLRGADLSNANLYETNLTSANLRGADLRGVHCLLSANLSGAKGDENTKLPYNYEVVDGFVQKRK